MSTNRGFSLIELMVTVAIVAILAAIAYPGYIGQVRKTRRSDAQATLLKTAQMLERCYTQFNAYNDTGCPVVHNSDNTKLADGSRSQPDYTRTEGGYYTISATTLSATAFTLQATPNGDQANDKCGKLTFNHIGVKGVVGANHGMTTDDCW